jgi:hypothetical protein
VKSRPIPWLQPPNLPQNVCARQCSVAAEVNLNGWRKPTQAETIRLLDQKGRF